ARSNFINGNAYALTGQSVNLLDGQLGPSHGHRFGDFQRQAVGRYPCLLQDTDDTCRQIGLIELHGRQVDRNHEIIQPVVLPPSQLSDGGFDDPFTNGDNQATGFGNGDEFGGVDVDQSRRAPAQQGFGPEYPLSVLMNLGLVDQT